VNCVAQTFKILSLSLILLGSGIMGYSIYESYHTGDQEALANDWNCPDQKPNLWWKAAQAEGESINENYWFTGAVTIKGGYGCREEGN